MPVVAGAGDAGAGGLGLGAIDDGEAFASLGTSAQLFVVTRRYRPAIPTLVHAFAHGVPERWFQMAAMLNGASALAWWCGVCATEPGALIAEAAREPILDSDPLFLPYLAGERTPHNDPGARGGFLDLSPATDRPAMTRAVLEGVGFCLADAQFALNEAGTMIEALGFTGGGARSAYWAQIVADILGVGVARYRGGEVGPALGAARLALAGLGHPFDRAFAKPEILDRFAPNAGRHDFERPRLAKWRSAYRALRQARA
jgi:xylulokinase